MLALTRKKGESIILNNDIEICILELRGDQVKIGISAPGSSFNPAITSISACFCSFVPENGSKHHPH